MSATDKSDIMNTPHYQTASDAFDSWHREVITGTAPTFYRVGDGELARIEIGPNLVTLIGGAPGAGKTAFTMQCAVDALRLNTSLRVLICNIEMTPQVLLDRQLARLSGIDVSTIRYRKLDETHADRLDQALNTLESIADRLCFLQQPLNLTNVAASADEFGAQLLVLDYIQRIPPPGEFGDRRGSIDATMNYLRKFASEGIAVMVVAAVARQKDKQGRSSYAGDALSLASFRESSELEFGADDAFILTPDKDETDLVTLRHLKARHTEPRDIELRFERTCQSFTPTADADRARQPIGVLAPELAALWDQTEPADDLATGKDDK